MGGYIDSLSDSGSGSDNESSPIDNNDKEPGSSDKETNNKQLQNVHNPAPPEQNTSSSSGPVPKEPTPGQVVDLPPSGKLEDAKFKDTNKEDRIPLDRGFKSKHDHGSGRYGFGSGPPVSEQAHGGMGGRICQLKRAGSNMAKLRVHLLVGLRSSTTTVVHRAEAGVGVLRGLRVGPEVVRAEEMVRRRCKWRDSNH